MKLVSYRRGPASAPLKTGVILSDGAILDLSLAWSYAPSGSGSNLVEKLPTSMLDLLSVGPRILASLKEMVDWAETLTEDDRRADMFVPTIDVTLGPPIPRPGKILCAGRNYAEHLEEGKRLWAGERELKVSPFPVGFAKVGTTVIGPGEPVIHPSATKTLDYELELAVVIGSTAKYVSVDEALQYVAGYTIANDISARDLQREEMRHQFLLLGKNFDTFCPMGPYLLTADELPDPQRLQMELRVNGEVRQHASTELMIYSVAEQIAHWSQMTLEPGDVLLTGTPAGVAQARQPDPTLYFLKPGDLLEGTIDKLGVLRNPVVAESE